MEAEARLKVAMEMGEVTARGLVAAQGRGEAQEDEQKDEQKDEQREEDRKRVIQLNATVAPAAEQSRPLTLFELANMNVSSG